MKVYCPFYIYSKSKKMRRLKLFYACIIFRNEENIQITLDTRHHEGWILKVFDMWI